MKIDGNSLFNLYPSNIFLKNINSMYFWSRSSKFVYTTILFRWKVLSFLLKSFNCWKNIGILESKQVWFVYAFIFVNILHHPNNSSSLFAYIFVIQIARFHNKHFTINNVFTITVKLEIDWQERKIEINWYFQGLW